MTYSVYQHWDPLKVVVVGATYPPNLYDYISDKKVRNVFYKIAEETEEDYQKLITLLESFNVKVLRPDMRDSNARNIWLAKNNKIIPKPKMMQPRDYTIMLGDKFFFIPQTENMSMDHIVDHIKSQGNKVINSSLGQLNGAMTIRVGKDLYIGTNQNQKNNDDYFSKLKEILARKYGLDQYRIHIVDSQGHTDGVFCAVAPGLLVSTTNYTYENTFPDWEVVYLENEGWGKVRHFLDLKKKNYGKWWVPGEELNNEFTEFVEQWMDHWVGYVEESVFDVNMLIIDKNNVIVNGYNEKVFDAFSRHNITPHICNFRHRYFWDGGLHCITSDLHREGTMQDYFPE